MTAFACRFRTITRQVQGALLLAACTVGSCASPAAAGPYRNPIFAVPEPVGVTRLFDGPAQPWLPGHRGVDIAATPGTVVLAANDGLVAWSGMVGGFGAITIEHGDGLYTTYTPVVPFVFRGMPVKAGMPIATVAQNPAHPALHFGAYLTNDKPRRYVDPLKILGKQLVVLRR